MRAYKNTHQSINGIEVAVLSAFFHQRNKTKINTTIIIERIKSVIKCQVAI
jgi:hypothetical protein